MAQLVADTSFRQSEVYQTALTEYEQRKARLVNASYLLQVLKQAKLNWQRPEMPRAAKPGCGFSDMATANNIYGPPETEAEVEAWTVTERLILQIARESTQHGADFAVMTITTPLQVHPDPQFRSRAAAELDAQDLFYLERRLSRLGAAHGIPVLALAESLQSVAQEQKLFLHGFPNTEPGTGHWNRSGHRLAGQRLARWLSQDAVAGTRLAARGGPPDP